ncbi:glutathione S-transferase family protein [Variovorax dokdonensis]|uniref:Glutathione S-transferase family protein n=1 Tax=Variovorax dokdonensis TaxID=344883 RepID=A0ABT7N7X0_9BURK|nr:glutathione S-transferase family protein [Variovorax dokdonensis]MDM0044022.1 glutathione S-transferase family protein [Variovorax dokdonensis]
MSLDLYYHPYSRAAGTLWALEEVGVPYKLKVVDIMKGEQKGPELVALNPMGKLPTLVDGGVVITEGAAIALYLADRYAAGRLAPALDAPERGTYLRWAFFAPSVVEPAVMAKNSGWEVKEISAGWGNHASMLAAADSAIAGRQFVLGDEFSMADVVLGGLLRFLIGFKQIDATPTFSAYVERLEARPALQRAEARNQAMRQELGLQ